MSKVLGTMKFWCLILLGVFCDLFVGSKQQEPLTSPTLPRRKSPPNVLNFAGKTYYFSTIFKGNYFQAIQFCNKHGMQLVSITTQAENDRLGRFAEEIGVSYEHFWTSGTKLQDDGQGWIWLSTGAPFAYTNWYPGEPNFEFIEHCVEARTSDSKGFKWNNTNCGYKNYFICESSSPNCTIS